jgi:N-acetylneuraminate synthase
MTIQIGARSVGPGSRCLVVAELSGNHQGDLGRALATIEAAAEAGADAIKLQTYTPETITIQSDRPEFTVPGNGPWGGRRLWDLYREAHTPWAWHPRLFELARGAGLEIFSTPFDHSAVRLLEELGAPAHKIASFELIDDGLLVAVAETGKPIILSTGMANLEEIGHALDILRSHDAGPIVVLRCTSSYPAPDEAMRLASLPALAAATGCPVGLSDHSLGIVAPIVAVTLGACLIEKHFTLDRDRGGVDSHFSLEPAELAELVRGIRRAEAMIGTPSFGPGLAEESSVTFRRSLYVVEDVDEGEALTERNVRSIRPGFGMSPRYAGVVLGRRVARAVARGTPLAWDLIAPRSEDRAG